MSGNRKKPREERKEGDDDSNGSEQRYSPRLRREPPPPPRTIGPTDSEIRSAIIGGNINPAIDAIMRYPEVNPYLRGLMMEKLDELRQLIRDSEAQQGSRMRREEEAMGGAEEGRMRINQARAAVVANMTTLLENVDASHASNSVIEGIMKLILQNSEDIQNTVGSLEPMERDRQIEDAPVRGAVAMPGYNYEVHRLLIDLLGGSIYTSLLHGLNTVQRETSQFLADTNTRATALLVTTLIITNLPQYFNRLRGSFAIAGTGLALFYSAPVLRAGRMLTASLSCGFTGACSILQGIRREGIIRPTQEFIKSVFANLGNLGNLGKNMVPDNVVTRRLGESLTDFCGSLYPIYDDDSVSSKASTRSHDSVMAEIENLTQGLEADNEMVVGGAIAGMLYTPATESGEMPLEVIVPPQEVIVSDEIGAMSDISSSQGSESKASSSQESESKGLYEDLHTDEENEEKGGTKRKRRRKSNKKRTKKHIKKGGRRKRKTIKKKANKRKKKGKTNKK